MTVLLDWPTTWYRFTKTTFRLRSFSQVTAKTWIGGRSVYGPHAQIWVAQMSLAVGRQDTDAAQEMAAFFSRLDGQAGVMRIGDPARRDLRINRQQTGDAALWSDGRPFNGGTGWSLTPATGTVAVAGSRGDNSLTITGLGASVTNAVAVGDLFEIRPGGVATSQPHLYEAQQSGSSDGSGAVGFEIRPRLRTGVAVGDQVVFRDAKTAFRVIDDDQGAAEVELPLHHYTQAFSLIEAIV